MKIKGIPLHEQHVEKFVVGAFAALLVGIVAWQFVGRPNRVTVDGQQIDPAEIEPRLKQKADAVRARLSESSTVAPLVEGELPLAAADFERSLTSGVSPRTTLPTTQPALAGAILPSDVTAEAARFRVPSFAAPRMIGVRQESDTLADSVVQQHPELASRFPAAGEPYDITWAIPIAEIDVASMRSELRAADAAAKPPLLAVPSLWHNDSLWIVDVVFERQQRLADGSWGAAEVVATLPGQFTFRPEIPRASAGTRDAMFAYLSEPDKVVEILQPDFLPTKGNVFSPSLILGQILGEAEAAASGEDPAVRRLRQTYNRKKADRDRVAAQLAAAGGPLEAERPEDRRDRGRDRESGGGGGGGGGGGAAPPGGALGGGGFGKRSTGADPAQDEAAKRKRVALTQKLGQLDAELAQLAEELQALAPALELSQGTGAGLLDLAKDERVLAWAHDIGVQPGQTYRYRATVESYNPFFTRKRQLVREQQELADPFTLRSRTSEWGPGVGIEPPVAFFVADAAAGEGRLGLGMAKIEVYRFFDGQRRLETFIVQPGDPIGGAAERPRGGGPAVDFSTDWYVVDVIEDNSGERGDRRGAQVVLRRSGDPTLLIRSPRADLVDDTRLRYNDDIEAARIAAAAERRAPATPPSPPDAPAAPPAGPPRGPGFGSGGGGPGGGGPGSPR